MIKCMNYTDMNRSLLKCLFTQIFWVCLLSIGILNAQQSQLVRPHIIDIKISQDEVLVRAFVPEGYKQVFVEGKPRFEVGAWVPRAVIYTEGKKGEYEFRLSVSEKIEWLRIRAESEIPVPVTAFLGESDFVGPVANDENVLFDALSEHRIGAACIDVFEQEPYGGKLITLDNCFVTCHMGSCTVDCRFEMEKLAVEEALRFVRGDALRQSVPEYEYELQKGIK